MHSRDRITWTMAMGLADVLHDCSQRFPRDERFEMARQLRRAAISVPANLAEGAARASPREFRRFLRISLGSLAEARTYVDFAARRGWLTDDERGELECFFDRVEHRLVGLVDRLEQEMRNAAAGESAAK